MEQGTSPAQVFADVSRQAPGLKSMRPHIRCAIDDEYAGWDDALHEGAELAFIPPTAGG